MALDSALVDYGTRTTEPSLGQIARRSNTLARQWQTLNTDLALKKLLRYEPEERQQFADLVHELFIEPEEPDNVDRCAEYLAQVEQYFSRPQDEQQRAEIVRDAYVKANAEAEVVKQRFSKLLEVFTLDFPALQKVVVQYCGWSGPADANTPITPLVVDHLIQPALRDLSLRSEMLGNLDYDAYRAVNNVLPLLNKTNTPSLQKLKLCLNVVGATDDQLVSALRGCPNITYLTLARNLAGLLNDGMFEYLACGSKLVTFATSAPIEARLFETWIPKSPTLQPIFTSLEEVDFPISEIVAGQLFPYMTKLRSVRLRLQQVDDVLSSLHLLPSLTKLELKSEIWHFPLTLQWLRPLQDLKLERLGFEQRIGQANFYVEDLGLQDISSMFGNQHALKNLSVAFGSSNNPTFLQDDVPSAPTIASLSPGDTIFNHLTTLHTGMHGAAAKELFPRMPAIKELKLYVDQHDGVVDWLANLPRLRSLKLIARAHILLTTRYLRGLQSLNLSTLEIHGQGAFGFEGHMITVDNIDTLFGSHQTLRTLKVAWEGDSHSANNPSFLQYSPHLLIERVSTHYRALQTLEMPAPCAAIDLSRLPERALNSNIEWLDVDRIAAPTQNPFTHPVEYRTAIRNMAGQLIKHFPRLKDVNSDQDEDLVDEIWIDYEMMRRGGRARR
ncbi:hypothetical protein KCU65_g5726, partial [Aureobasidium melanogenum]